MIPLSTHSVRKNSKEARVLFGRKRKDTRSRYLASLRCVRAVKSFIPLYALLRCRHFMSKTWNLKKKWINKWKQEKKIDSFHHSFMQIYTRKRNWTVIKKYSFTAFGIVSSPLFWLITLLWIFAAGMSSFVFVLLLSWPSVSCCRSDIMFPVWELKTKK